MRPSPKLAPQRQEQAAGAEVRHLAAQGAHGPGARPITVPPQRELKVTLVALAAAAGRAGVGGLGGGIVAPAGQAPAQPGVGPERQEGDVRRAPGARRHWPEAQISTS